MKEYLLLVMTGWSLVMAAQAEVRVFVEEGPGVAWIKYECTAGEVIRSFALDVSVDRGQFVGISDFFVGPSSASSRGYGIFPASFRDHITVSSGTSANWSVSGYNPLAVVADAPSDTLPGLGSGGVTLEFGALWDPAVPAAAPPATGTLCALQLSEEISAHGANVTVTANATRGGVVTSPDGSVIAPTFVGTHVGPLPEIAVEQPAGVNVNDDGSVDFGPVVAASGTALRTFTIRNTGTGDLTGLVLTRDGANPSDFTVTSQPTAPVSGGGGFTNFTIAFTPATTGSRNAIIHIANNDSDESPFDITLTGLGLTTFQGWIAAAGVPDPQAGPEQSPHGDGVTNLQKFAFNLDPTRPDTRHLAAGGSSTAGLPAVAISANGRLHLEFIRRKATGHPGIIYRAQFSTNLVNWVDLTGLARVTSIDDIWERAEIDDVQQAGGNARFARLMVREVAIGGPPAPLIEVEQADGIGMIDGLSTVDFGTASTATPSAVTLTVKNTGTSDLTGLAVGTDGPHAGDFTAGSLGTTTLAAGAATTFTMTFVPTAAGPRAAAIHITSNDSASGPLDIGLSGTGILTTLQSWRQTHFGRIDNNGDGEDLNDFDKDGIANLLEFAFGLHPRQNSSGMLPRPQRDGTDWVVSFTCPAGVSGITYGAEWSATLLPGSWTTLADTGTPPQHTFRLTVGAQSKVFLRLKVTNP